jgi:hypothetical protein
VSSCFRFVLCGALCVRCGVRCALHALCALSAFARSRKKSGFREAIVFVIGGGNYIEFQNIQDYAKKDGKKIVYGATELLTAAQFTEQVNKLAN